MIRCHMHQLHEWCKKLASGKMSLEDVRHGHDPGGHRKTKKTVTVPKIIAKVSDVVCYDARLIFRQKKNKCTMDTTSANK